MHAVSGDVPVSRSVLPEGEAGVDATVQQMARLAHSEWGSKSPRIRALAMNIINRAGVTQKDYYGEILAIHTWIKNPRNIRYFLDPIGQETLADPEQTAFNLKGGDCDDKTVLEIALLGSVGIPAYPVVVGQRPNSFCHVYLHAIVPPGKHRNANKVVPLDPIMPHWPAGREAQNIKSKKTYPQFANPLGMQGNNMSGLHGYGVGPSYLDMDEAHVNELIVPDKKACFTYEDGSVANSVRVTQPQDGIDALMGFGTGVGAELPPTGGYFTETSAGGRGTISTSEGQLVPRGFLRNEPSRQEIMAMTPASARDLGPLGPIYNRRARSETGGIPRVGHPAVPTWSNALRKGGLPAQSVNQTVGQKRYTLPTVTRALSKENLTGRQYRPEFLRGQKTVNVKPMNIERLGQEAKPVPLGEELADYVYTHGQICGMLEGFKQVLAKQGMPMAHRQKAMKELHQLLVERDKLEKRILEIQQLLRQKNGGIIGRPIPIRALAVAAQVPQAVFADDNMLRPAGSVNARVDGLSGVTDLISSPFVYLPAIALAGIVGWKLLNRKKRR